MFGDQKAVIPLILLGPSCDLFNSSACVVAACGLGKSNRIKLINIVYTSQEGQLRLDKVDDMTCD